MTQDKCEICYENEKGKPHLCAKSMLYQDESMICNCCSSCQIEMIEMFNNLNESIKSKFIEDRRNSFCPKRRLGYTIDLELNCPICNDILIKNHATAVSSKDIGYEYLECDKNNHSYELSCHITDNSVTIMRQTFKLNNLYQVDHHCSENDKISTLIQKINTGMNNPPHIYVNYYVVNPLEIKDVNKAIEKIEKMILLS